MTAAPLQARQRRQYRRASCFCRLVVLSSLLPLADAFKGVFLSSPSQLLRAFPKSRLLCHLFQDILVKLAVRWEGGSCLVLDFHSHIYLSGQPFAMIAKLFLPAVISPAAAGIELLLKSI